MEGQKIIDMKDVDLNKPGLLSIEVEKGNIAQLYLAGVVLKVAVANHQPVGYFTPDHDNTRVINRLLAKHCGISQKKIANGDLATDEWKKLDERLPDLTAAPLYIDDTPEMTVEQISEKIRMLANEHDVRFVAIEHVRKLAAEEKDLCEVSRTLHELGEELGVVILAIVNDLQPKNINGIQARKGKVIFTPGVEESRQLLENAWQEFLEKVEEAGCEDIESISDGALKEIFAAGWAYGWNDGYGIIKGQLDAINLEHELNAKQ